MFACFNLSSFPSTILSLPRKAKEALEEDIKDKPILVMESLPYGCDNHDTLPLGESEMDLVAQSFDAEEPSIPSPPPVVSQMYVVW